MDIMGKQPGSSPVSVVGFACASLSCASDATGSSGQRSSGGSQTSLNMTSPPRSLLSQLLEKGASQQHDDYEDDDDDCSCDSEDEDGFNVDGLHPTCSQGYKGAQQCAPQPMQQRSSPIAVPNTLYLKDVNAIAELRRIQYERYARRAQMEMQAQQQFAAQVQAQQGRCA